MKARRAKAPKLSIYLLAEADTTKTSKQQTGCRQRKDLGVVGVAVESAPFAKTTMVDVNGSTRHATHPVVVVGRDGRKLTPGTKRNRRGRKLGGSSGIFLLIVGVLLLSFSIWRNRRSNDIFFQEGGSTSSSLFLFTLGVNLKLGIYYHSLNTRQRNIRGEKCVEAVLFVHRKNRST